MDAQLHVSGVVPDFWIAIVRAEIQNVSSHCGDVFCSISDVCSDGAEGSEDGRINAAGKIQKGPDNFLEAGFVGCGKQRRRVDGCG